MAQVSGRPADPGAPDQPWVWLGRLTEDSVAVSVFVMVREGVRLRPELAAGMRCTVRVRFLDDHPPVRIAFRPEEIEVSDDVGEQQGAADLELSGRLGDIAALVLAPLAAGLPNPATRAGRGALLRLADGRIGIDGPLSLARSFLRLVAVDAHRAAAARRPGTV